MGFFLKMNLKSVLKENDIIKRDIQILIFFILSTEEKSDVI
jgi:hypothetical protein